MSPQQCPVCLSPMSSTARHCSTCGASLSPASTSSAPVDILAPGTELRGSSYTISKLLGRGGFGITYLGTDNRLKRQAAIKEFFLAGSTRHRTNVVPPTTFAPADYDTATQRFLQEAQVLGRFQHLNIVAVYDVFQENATAYMVMEYLEGKTWMETLEQRGAPLLETEIVDVARPLVDALERIHAAGVLHRDIKPANIILDDDAGKLRPVLIDFGAARDFVRGMTLHQSVILTPGYAPLEQYGERAQRGPYTDIYALAATLYHLATGVPPTAAIDRAVGIELKSPRELNPALSLSFERALLHALEMRADQRPQSARALLQELVQLPGNPSSAPSPASQPQTQPPTPQLASPPRAAPTTNAPSAIGQHRAKLQHIARELNVGGMVQTDKLICPVCREAAMIEPAKATGPLRCPVCRAAGLKERIAAHTHGLCPHCQTGTLHPVKMNGLIYCPVCRTGVVSTYTKQRKALIFADLWAKCDRCSADFDYTRWKDLLTLRELPDGSGLLAGDLQGQTKRRGEWAELANRSDQVYQCDTCKGEFDKRGPDSYELVAIERDPGRVPPEYRGVAQSEFEWIKRSHRLAPTDGTIFCPACRAQFDDDAESQLQLLDAPHDPFGVATQYSQQRLPVSTWRAIAASAREPAESGYVCPACTAELIDPAGRSPLKGMYQLKAYDRGRDPYGAGPRYQNNRLARHDWQRIAAGKPTRSVEEELHTAADHAFWHALLAGEFGDPEAAASYTSVRRAGENVLLHLTAKQFKQTKDGMSLQDQGTMWVTTKKLFFQGSRANATIPIDKLTEVTTQKSGFIGSDLLALWREDRVKPVFFHTSAKPTVSVEGVTVRLNWTTPRFAELLQALRRVA